MNDTVCVEEGERHQTGLAHCRNLLLIHSRNKRHNRDELSASLLVSIQVRYTKKCIRLVKKVVFKGSFLYSAVSSPVDRSKRFTLFASPDRPVHSDTNSASPGSILARQQLRAKTKSLTCPPLSIARYSFIQLSQLGPPWRERKCPIFETVANGDSNPGSLDCESGILPLSYRAPLCYNGNLSYPF